MFAVNVGNILVKGTLNGCFFNAKEKSLLKGIGFFQVFFIRNSIITFR